MGESGESGEGTNGDKGGTNGDKSSPCGGSVAASRSGVGSAQTVISSGGDGQQIPSGMDPPIAFFLSIRMETTVLVSGGTKGKHCGFSFPLVVDCTSSYTNFMAAICAKYPWGLFDAVEIRYWNSSKLCWVPVQCDAELGVMFASNATTMSCNLEITVIQRTRGQRCVNPSSSRPSASRTRASSRTPSAPRTPSVNATASVNERQEHQKKTLDPVVEEALPDAPAVEDEVLYPGYVQHNNDEEDAADKEYIPAEFSDADEDEKQEDVEMRLFEDAAEDRPVEMYDRENPCIAEGVVFPSAVDCRNAVASFSIKSETEFLTLKSDPTRLKSTHMSIHVLV
ncbi:histone-lysine n-methyltransferase atxr3 [Hordeum vulgare]|nr:histone-lysine n-methyltransferase atxr3 [Hordeum vulgare]